MQKRMQKMCTNNAQIMHKIKTRYAKYAKNHEMQKKCKKMQTKCKNMHITTYVTQDRRGHPDDRAVQLRHTSHQ